MTRLFPAIASSDFLTLRNNFDEALVYEILREDERGGR